MGRARARDRGAPRRGGPPGRGRRPRLPLDLPVSPRLALRARATDVREPPQPGGRMSTTFAWQNVHKPSGDPGRFAEIAERVQQDDRPDESDALFLLRDASLSDLC